MCKSWQGKGGLLPSAHFYLHGCVSIDAKCRRQMKWKFVAKGKDIPQFQTGFLRNNINLRSLHSSEIIIFYVLHAECIDCNLVGRAAIPLNPVIHSFPFQDFRRNPCKNANVNMAKNICEQLNALQLCGWTNFSKCGHRVDTQLHIFTCGEADSKILTE